ncbi:STAS domain-containing protein [Lysobacter sp. A289]
MATRPATVSRDGDALVFNGALEREAVPALWKSALPHLQGVIRFELGQVSRVDSAGVALLAELASRADQAAIVGDPAGLAELRAAYRLGPDLDFSH